MSSFFRGSQLGLGPLAEPMGGCRPGAPPGRARQLADATVFRLGDDARSSRNTRRSRYRAGGAQSVLCPHCALGGCRSPAAGSRCPAGCARRSSKASSFPRGPTGFALMPMQPLRFRSVVVASINDRYVSLQRARAFADAWESAFVNIGQAGHINSASGLGEWREGLVLLRDLQLRQACKEDVG
jgi:hypothetical protein